MCTNVGAKGGTVRGSRDTARDCQFNVPYTAQSGPTHVSRLQPASVWFFFHASQGPNPVGGPEAKGGGPKGGGPKGGGPKGGAQKGGGPEGWGPGGVGARRGGGPEGGGPGGRSGEGAGVSHDRPRAQMCTF